MRKVLSVGQCGFDHPRIKHMIESNFDVKVDLAHTGHEAIRATANGDYDLILVNRLLDADGSSGVKLIEFLKKQDATASTAMMLVSNYDDAQSEAISAGAVRGFGKNALNNLDTLSALRAALAH